MCVGQTTIDQSISDLFVRDKQTNKQTNMEKKEILIIICSVHHFDSFCFSRRICFFKFKKLLIIKCLFMFSLFSVDWIGHRNHPFNDERMEKSILIIQHHQDKKQEKDTDRQNEEEKQKQIKVQKDKYGCQSKKKIIFIIIKKLISLFENKNKQESCSSSSSFEKQKQKSKNQQMNQKR